MTTASSSGSTDVPGKVTGVWTDGIGREWRIEADAARMVLVSDEDVLDIPASAWSRDIYVSSHGDGFIIRIENFDHSVGFVVPNEDARPLLAVLGRGADESVAVPDESESAAASGSTSRMALAWPRVSPLAVWSLICAVPAFVPVIGIPPAIASAVLLVLHRRRVPHSPVWRHSRALCLAASLFLVLGLTVSVLASMSSVRKTDTTTRLGAETGAPTGSVVVHSVKPTASDPQLRTASFLDENHNWGMILAGLVVVILSLTVHEGAHAISAWWLGDDFARRLGRVTMNPIAHIDPLGTVILPLLLFVSGMMVFGWAKSVPVRIDGLSRPRRAHILISLAGPGSNLVLAGASLLLLLGISSIVWLTCPNAQMQNVSGLTTLFEAVKANGFALAPIVGPACTVLKLSFLINTFLAFFNLIPIPPLDGSWVLEHAFPHTLGPFYARLRPYAFLVFLGLLYLGALEYLLLPAIYALGLGMSILAQCTPY